jgi:7-keto-8-aminopelargonate synthetase-like enzyme
MGGVEDLLKACKLLWEHNILITPAMYPAVPLERNLVRFSITAANTEVEIDQAVAALQAVHEMLMKHSNQAPGKAVLVPM